MLRLHPSKRLVRHINGEMITGLMRRLYPRGSIKNGRSPLIRFATDETVKFIEARMSGPTIKRSGNRDLPRRRFVILAKRSGAVAIQSQHFCKRRHALRADAGITWKRSREFHDRTRVV